MIVFVISTTLKSESAAIIRGLVHLGASCMGVIRRMLVCITGQTVISSDKDADFRLLWFNVCCMEQSYMCFERPLLSFDNNGRSNHIAAHIIVKPWLLYDESGTNQKTLMASRQPFSYTMNKARYCTEELINDGLSAVECPKTPST